MGHTTGFGNAVVAPGSLASIVFTDQLAMLAPSLLNDPNYTLSEINYDDSRVESDRDHRRSFEMVADDGEVIGYIRT